MDLKRHERIGGMLLKDQPQNPLLARAKALLSAASLDE
jgi:hypothetical protein